MDLELNVGGYDCEEEGSDGKFRGVVVFKMWRKRSSQSFWFVNSVEMDLNLGSLSARKTAL